jgi:hypothetical protein
MSDLIILAGYKSYQDIEVGEKYAGQGAAVSRVRDPESPKP